MKSFRYHISLVMTAVYLLIILAPLTPAALQSDLIAHAITGACAGDCRICGCSPERSAAGTCCCALKKITDKNRVKVAEAGKCGDCNAAPRPLKKAVSPCCAAAKQAAASPDHDHCAVPEKNSRETAISTIPCGSWKMLAFGGSEVLHMPFAFSSSIPRSQSPLEYHPLVDRLTSCAGEPPDPPPKAA